MVDRRQSEPQLLGHLLSPAADRGGCPFPPNAALSHAWGGRGRTMRRPAPARAARFGLCRARYTCKPATPARMTPPARSQTTGPARLRPPRCCRSPRHPPAKGRAPRGCDRHATHRNRETSAPRIPCTTNGTACRRTTPGAGHDDVFRKHRQRAGESTYTNPMTGWRCAPATNGVARRFLHQHL